MRHVGPAALVIAALATGCATVPERMSSDGCADTVSPAGVACGFYQRCLQLRPVGLPTEVEQAALAPFLSERLERLLEQARARQSEFGQQFPGEKPPLVDGSLFSSMFEGPTSFEVGAAVKGPGKDGVTRVPVSFRDGSEAAWQDVVLVKREQDRHVIDDIEYGGAGEFNPPGRLSETLERSGE
jgi:hypothetical protein